MLTHFDLTHHKAHTQVLLKIQSNQYYQKVPHLSQKDLAQMTIKFKNEGRIRSTYSEAMTLIQTQFCPGVGANSLLSPISTILKPFWIKFALNISWSINRR